MSLVRAQILGFIAFFIASCILHAWNMSRFNDFLSIPSLLLLMVSSYYVYAFLFGLKMPVLVGVLESKRHSIFRLMVFTVFFAFWLKLLGIW